ncbi:LPXTG cell wall anchor domain-containing protein [[Clostridium] innocuum]|nr:LPXTG cell wall anchor domain-containing protein [[Clostridium] innocuum]
MIQQNTLPKQLMFFGIYAREDIYDYMGNVAIPYGTLIDTTGIDELGQFDHFPDLPNGVYYVKELQTNNMYNLDETEYDFEIAWHGGDVSKYTINIGSDEGIVNELQRGKVIIHKTDLDTKEALKDVEFVMSTDKDFEHIVDTVKTNDKGIAEFNELELGHYFIKENPVDGYVTNQHIYEVDITQDGDELTIDVENKPLEMEFSKVDITNNEELEGAKLQVIDKETGKVIDKWISTKEPHKIKYLIEGKEYIMKEITAPKGYEIAESITFKAEDGVKITMKDKLIPETPQTGDNTNIGLWLGLFGIASVTLLGSLYLNKKRKEDIDE